jgi:hypothetical protein
MPRERTPQETADVALRAADESTARVMDQLAQAARQDVLATLLDAGLYAEGAAMARRMGFNESHVFDLLMQSAEISDDDQAMISEAVYGFEALLEVV